MWIALAVSPFCWQSINSEYSVTAPHPGEKYIQLINMRYLIVILDRAAQFYFFIYLFIYLLVIQRAVLPFKYNAELWLDA